MISPSSNQMISQSKDQSQHSNDLEASLMNPTFAANEATMKATINELSSPKLTFRRNHQLKVGQGKRKAKTFPKCAFTSALLCNEPSKCMMCAASKNHHHCEVMVKCMQW
jgi:hypothetical protein